MQDIKSSPSSPEESLKKFGISLGIVVGVFALPVLIVGLWGPANASIAILLHVMRHPKTILLTIIAVGILFELAIAVIPTPEVRDAFAMLARLVNVGMWMAAGLMFVAWLCIESYDAYALEVNWIKSADVAIVLSPEGRKIVNADRMKFERLGPDAYRPKYQHVWDYVSRTETPLSATNPKRYPRFDIRPMKFLSTMSEAARYEWAPIIAAFFPYTQNLKANALDLMQTSQPQENL
jgi:hypothetical protein